MLAGADSPVGSPSFHTSSNYPSTGAHFAFSNIRKWVLAADMFVKNGTRLVLQCYIYMGPVPNGSKWIQSEYQTG